MSKLIAAAPTSVVADLFGHSLDTLAFIFVDCRAYNVAGWTEYPFDLVDEPWYISRCRRCGGESTKHLKNRIAPSFLERFGRWMKQLPVDIEQRFMVYCLSPLRKTCSGF